MHIIFTVFIDTKNHLSLISMDKNISPKIVVLVIAIYNYEKLLTIGSTSFVLTIMANKECHSVV
jgi:hypothetical protein